MGASDESRDGPGTRTPDPEPAPSAATSAPRLRPHRSADGQGRSDDRGAARDRVDAGSALLWDGPATPGRGDGNDYARRSCCASVTGLLVNGVQRTAGAVW